MPEVKSIVLSFHGDIEITLTTEEARKLYEQLGELFGMKVTVNPSPVMIEKSDWPGWREPCWVPSPSEPLLPKIWCSTTPVNPE